MNITKEDIDAIVSEIGAAGAAHNSSDRAWVMTEDYQNKVEFLWEFYQSHKAYL